MMSRLRKGHSAATPAGEKEGEAGGEPQSAARAATAASAAAGVASAAAAPGDSEGGSGAAPPSGRRRRGGSLVQSSLPASDGRWASDDGGGDPLAPPRRESDGEDDEDEEEDDCLEPAPLDSPLVIPADASLLDGLRALLVHHLKRSVGARVVSLSASQAELLEHHLARLASYATKIVHTLAFATRFLSKQQGDQVPEGTTAGALDHGGRPTLLQHPPNAQHAQRQPQPWYQEQPASPEPKPQRKALKLNDDEILSLYRSAQAEAAIEADWRGVTDTTMSRDGAAASDGWQSAAGSGGGTPARDSPTATDAENQEYLRMLSRAMQQPGRSPRAFTAAILNPSRERACCRPQVDAPTITLAAAGKTGFLLSPAASPPDPGSQRHQQKAGE